MPKLEELRDEVDAGHTVALLKDTQVRYHVYRTQGKYVYCVIQDRKPTEFPYLKWEALLCRDPQLTITCVEWRVL